jgi:hypothetical protein
VGGNQVGDEIKEFAAAIGAKEPNSGDKNYKLFRQVFKRSNYFVLDGKFAIIKISRSDKPFWGVGKDYIDFLNNTGNYFLVLLVSNREGWVFTKAEINNHINSANWRLREADNNYKINVPLPDTNSFTTPSHFLRKIGLDQKATT